MKKALSQARLAAKHGEVPIGAVIVDADDNIIARGYNLVEGKGCQIEHAEAIAIRKACKKVDGWRLSDCWIYVTLEPCVMCIGLIGLSRFAGVVYGTRSTLFGFSLVQEGAIDQILRQTTVISGVREQECLGLLQSFFKKARTKRKV